MAAEASDGGGPAEGTVGLETDRPVAADDPSLRWEGAAGLEPTGDGVRPWRLPYERQELYPGAELLSRARMPAGVRVVFATESRTVGLELTTSTPETSPVDVVVDGEPVATLPVPATGTRQWLRAEGLPGTRKTVEIWLPHFGEVVVHGLTVDDSTRIEPVTRTRGRWLTYGSSITHCRLAPSPTRTWPALVARSNGWDLTCLGFGGQAKLDPMVARYIRDTPADLISLCLGINMYAQAYERLFLPAVLGFLATVRDGHPAAPIVVITPICSPEREDTPGQPGGMALGEIRAAVADGVRRLRAAGDTDLHLVDGLTVLGPADTGRLADGLHPDAAGYALMAERLAPRLAVHLPGPGPARAG